MFFSLINWILRFQDMPDILKLKYSRKRREYRKTGYFSIYTGSYSFSDGSRVTQNKNV